MTSEQIGGIARAVLTAIGGYIAGKGLLPMSLVNEIIGVGVTLAVAFWSYKNKPSA